ncbi:GCD complex subunit gcd7 [Saxophila tyrrhenica]|uniref:Translation initiation factor eIF2B subunit beta n=1 Tax=Saxophila tyrrhenica TaxID=1690608 RepID=A0AAV9PFI5_9PEZI|nr:GCD complex subunit gcd7 [Saxophila tyrrhenica]
MPAATVGQTPSLTTFLKSLKTSSVESSIELLASLLKRRQIKNSRQCALATAQLLRRVVGAERIKDPQKLIDRIRDVGRRLVAAQPREMAVGNIVRRVLGVVREVVEEQLGDDGSGSSGPSTPTSPTSRAPKRPMISHTFSSFTPLSHGAAMPYDMHPRPGTPGSSSPSGVDRLADATAAARRPGLATSASYASIAPTNASLLSFLEHPLGRSPGATPPATSSPRMTPVQSSMELNKEKIDIKAEVIDGIKDLLDELEVVDSQIAESALDHIHSNETILTHTSSQTVQKFLATAARKRKFTVIHAEAYPNDHEATHATILNGGKKSTGDDDEVDDRWKPLTALGITVIMIPDTAVFALMSRINKVILAPHTVLANGSLLAAAGASTIALAAQAHRVPVVVLSGVYKLSPVYPFDTQELIEYGDPGKVVPFEEGEFMDKVDVVNPVYDWVDAELVSLYVTNLGGCAPSFLYRIVADHYRMEDVDLGAKSG